MSRSEEKQHYRSEEEEEETKNNKQPSSFLLHVFERAEMIEKSIFTLTHTFSSLLYVILLLLSLSRWPWRMSFSLSPLIVNVISSSFSLFSNLSVYISLYKYVCSNFTIHLLRLVVSFLENDCIDSRNVENKMIFKVAVIFQFILKLLPLNKSKK